MGRDPIPAATLRALRGCVGDRVSVRSADLDAASRDASSLPGSRPDAVVWPLATDEVQAVVRLAADARVPVTARGAGSSLEGNPIPVHGGIVLDLSRMTRVLAVRAEDLQADVEPGVVYAALNRALRPHGLFFPPAPGGSADVATIGGMVANNASGIYSVRYGGTRDHVRAATVVTGAGDVLRLGNRCRKSASGYHLLGLLVGVGRRDPGFRAVFSGYVGLLRDRALVEDLVVLLRHGWIRHLYSTRTRARPVVRRRSRTSADRTCSPAATRCRSSPARTPRRR